MRAHWQPLLFAMVAWLVAGEAPAEDPGGFGTRGWTVHLDNDLFAFADRDRDYTAGIALTLSENAWRPSAFSPTRALDWLDRKSRVDGLHTPSQDGTRAVELGLLLFTPQDLGTTRPLSDDRPYANLIYLSGSRLTHEPDDITAQQSTLTLGFLGVPFAETLHRAVHDALGGITPMGYGHQISDGGEPTFRYAVSRYRLLARGQLGGRPYSLRLGVGGSLGYLTEGNAEISFRWGRSPLPWWSELSGSSDYAGHPSVVPLGGTPRAGRKVNIVLDAGLELRAPLYNAFLQGQFRDSPVTHGASRLNRLLCEFRLGITAVLPGGLNLSYTLRRQSPEIDGGAAARELTWASIGITQQF